MKKALFMAMAAFAISFASCGGNKTAEAPAEETEQAAEAFDVEGAVNNLQAQLESGDASTFQKALEAVKEQIAKLDPEVAKEYVTKVQDFLKANADKVKEVVGDNAVVNTLVTSIVETPAESIINEVQSKLGEVGQAGQDAVDNAVDQVKDAAEDAKQAAEDKVNEQVDKAKENAAKEIDNAADKVKKGLGL